MTNKIESSGIMKIGMFTDTYFPQVSGVSTSIKLLAEELRKRGHEVVIFTTTDPHAKAEANIVRVPSIPFISFSDRRIAYGGFDRCLKIARNMDLDIIHTHTEFSMGLAGKYVASRLKIPTLHTYHTMYENYTHYILDGLLIQPYHVKNMSRTFCNSSSGVVAPSRLTVDTLIDYGVKVPVRQIATGVEIPYYDKKAADRLRQDLGYGADDIVLLSLSRLSKEKNIQKVLEAYKELKKEEGNYHLVIVGDGPERDALEKFCIQNQLDVHFVGQVTHEEVASYYQMADLYINASTSESQGLTYLEALVNRCPLIAMRNDYLAGIVTEPAYGCLFDQNYSMVQAIKDYTQLLRAGSVPVIDTDRLYPLSVDRFADSIEEYYLDTILNYSRNQHRRFDRAFFKLKKIVREIVLGDD